MASLFLEAQDQEILDLFQIEGSQEKAFSMIVKKYQERLYWHIRRMVVSHEDTNDILQNVFIKVWKGLSRFSSRIRTLYVVVSNWNQ
jgi:DNA-directed RNA polymerase specialized sigma24 family protein